MNRITTYMDVLPILKSPNFVYHYTTRACAAQIVRDGAVRAVSDRWTFFAENARDCEQLLRMRMRPGEAGNTRDENPNTGVYTWLVGAESRDLLLPEAAEAQTRRKRNV